MKSKKIYIAPDGFVAFIDRAHTKHMQASAFFRYFAQGEFQIYTSNVSIAETYTTLYNCISPSLARDFIRALSVSDINILYPQESEMKAAIKTIATTNSVELTFSKALMAAICNKQNIPQIDTFEYLPSLYGLQVFYLPV